METLTESLKYRQWQQALQANGARLHQLQELHTVRKSSGEVLFSLLEVDAAAANGKPFLPIFLLRGRFVMAVTELTVRETGARFLLLVKQYRLANGGIIYSHPAGMCDSESDPIAVVIKEVREETGLQIGPEAISPLFPFPLYTSDGILDETGQLFLAQLTLGQAEIEALTGRETGAAGEHEYITLQVVTPQEAFQLIQNMAGQLCNYLYAARTGQLPTLAL